MLIEQVGNVLSGIDIVEHLFMIQMTQGATQCIYVAIKYFKSPSILLQQILKYPLAFPSK